MSHESSATQYRVLRHPRALGSGGSPFLNLGSGRLAIAYLKTWGHPPPRLVCSIFYYSLEIYGLSEQRFFKCFWEFSSSLELLFVFQLVSGKFRSPQITAGLLFGLFFRKSWKSSTEYRNALTMGKRG